MKKDKQYLIDFINSKGGPEPFAKMTNMNRQTIRQIAEGRNGARAETINMIADHFSDFDRSRALGILKAPAPMIAEKSMVQAATETPGQNQVSLLEERIRLLEESLEEKKRTIREREATIRFLTRTHPEFKEKAEEVSFSQDVTKERYKNRGPIRINQIVKALNWPKDQPGANA